MNPQPIGAKLVGDLDERVDVDIHALSGDQRHSFLLAADDDARSLKLGSQRAGLKVGPTSRLRKREFLLAIESFDLGQIDVRRVHIRDWDRAQSRLDRLRLRSARWFGVENQFERLTFAKVGELGPHRRTRAPVVGGRDVGDVGGAVR